MYVGVPVYVCTCVVRVCVRVWVCYECVLIPLPLYVFGCVLQRFGFVQWDPDPLQEIRIQFRFVPVMDPIHMQLKDRSMRWSVDQYQFVQWRPDGDSGLKPRHLMWVFALVSFPYFSLSILFIYNDCIISFDHVIYLTSMINVPFHMTSVIVHLMYLVDMSIYWRHFMC